jgi:hypothetical protein
MSTPISRRWFVAAIGGAVGVVSGTLAWRSQRGRWGGRPAVQSGDSLRYVDHDGWILTPADQERLAQAVSAPAGSGQELGARHGSR